MDYESHSPRETRAIAAGLAAAVSPGAVVCLNGELGAGKTEFVKGFAAGLGTAELVVSPTFTIMNEYTGGRMPLYHFDVYRITATEQMQDTGYEDYFYGDGVCVVEWAQNISGLLPREAIEVELEKSLARGDDYRRIRVTGVAGEAPAGEKL